MTDVGLWKFASINPLTPEFSELPVGTEVEFLPLENIWSHGKADYAERKRVGADSSYTQFRRGDILVPKVTPTVFHGRSMIADIEGEVGLATSEVHVLRAKSNADPRWLTYQMLTSRFLDATRGNIYGVAGLKRISTQYLTSYKVADTPLETQRRIADYLDKEISAMDALIEEFEGLAENLKTRKVLLTERITAQDDLGNKYPTYPIGLLFQKIGSGTTPMGDEWYTESEEDGIPWVTTSELREIDITETKKYVTKEAIEKVPGLRIHPAGSIMIAMYGATIGRFGKLEVPASCNQACCVLSNPYKIDRDFFYASLWAKRDALILFGSGGGQPNISQDVIKRFEMPVPPLEDQKKIAEQLQAENAHMDGLIHDATALAALLKERKTALITEVVTGRKEV